MQSTMLLEGIARGPESRRSASRPDGSRRWFSRPCPRRSGPAPPPVHHRQAPDSRLLNLWNCSWRGGIPRGHDPRDPADVLSDLYLNGPFPLPHGLPVITSRAGSRLARPNERSPDRRPSALRPARQCAGHRPHQLSVRSVRHAGWRHGRRSGQVDRPCTGTTPDSGTAVPRRLSLW